MTFIPEFCPTHVIFDFDGVLADSVDIKTRAFQVLYEEFGTAIVEKVTQHHLEHGGVSRFEKIRHYHTTFLNQPVTEQEVSRLASRFSDIVVEKVVQSAWIPGAQKLLDALKREGIPMFVASGTPEDELIKIVQQRGMAEYFIAVKGSPTPKADLVCGLVETYNLPQETTFMIGDASTDLKAAQAAKIQFIGRIEPNQAPFPDNILSVHDLSVILTENANTP